MTAPRRVVAGSPMVAWTYVTALFILTLTLASGVNQVPGASFKLDFVAGEG